MNGYELEEVYDIADNYVPEGARLEEHWDDE